MPSNTYTSPTIKRQADAGCPVTGLGAVFNPFGEPYLSDPYAFYIRARTEEPVFYSPEIDHWVITRYEDVSGRYCTIRRPSLPRWRNRRSNRGPKKRWRCSTPDNLISDRF